MAPRDLLQRLLSPAEARTSIPASPERVYAVLADPETYPDWLAGAQRIRHVDPSFPNPGAEFGHEVGPNENITMADDTTSLLADPPHRLQLEVHAGPVTGIADFQLTATGASTEVVLRESFIGRLGFTMPVMRAVIHARNKGSLARLKNRFEPQVIPLQ
ncbi:MAG: SRPBCC family protein [Acidimicrobiales bacterium]